MSGVPFLQPFHHYVHVYTLGLHIALRGHISPRRFPLVSIRALPFAELVRYSLPLRSSYRSLEHLFHMPNNSVQLRYAMYSHREENVHDRPRSQGDP